MRIYLDCCCLNRPYDDQRQERIRAETQALEVILGQVRQRTWVLVGSDALALEVHRIPDPGRRRAVEELLSSASEWIPDTHEVRNLAEAIRRQGIRGMDAMHLAAATCAGADIFLTVDKGLYSRAQKLQGLRLSAVGMPPDWLYELSGEAPR